MVVRPLALRCTPKPSRARLSSKPEKKSPHVKMTPSALHSSFGTRNWAIEQLGAHDSLLPGILLRNRRSGHGVLSQGLSVVWAPLVDPFFSWFRSVSPWSPPPAPHAYEHQTEACYTRAARSSEPVRHVTFRDEVGESSEVRPRAMHCHGLPQQHRRQRRLSKSGAHCALIGVERVDPPRPNQRCQRRACNIAVSCGQCG